MRNTCFSTRTGLVLRTETRTARLLLGMSFAVMLSGCADTARVTEPTAALTGAMRVEISVTGPNLASNGYDVAIGAQIRRKIQDGAPAIVAGLKPQSYTVELFNLPAECSVVGEKRQTLLIEAGRTTTVSFSIKCVPAGDGPCMGCWDYSTLSKAVIPQKRFS